METAHTDIAAAKEREALKRVPNTGPFNEVSIPIISSGAFGTVGYFVGKWLGKLGDDRTNKVAQGRFETGMKWLGAGGLGLLAASVAIRHTRDAKAQAVQLAKRSMELEQHNAALASVATKPVGSLIETLDQPSQTTPAEAPQVQVSEAESSGTVIQNAQGKKI